MHRRQHRRQPHRARERIYGRWQPYLDAGPVRAHIAALREAGIGVERIAQLAGLSVSHIRGLAEHDRGDSPTTRRVRPGTATRVLSIGLGDASRAPRSRVDPTAGTAHQVATLYQRPWNTTPPQATWRAACCRRGRPSPGRRTRLAPPLAWDDIDTEPTPPAPTAGPSRRNDIDEIAVERPLAGDHITYHDLTPVEQHEVIGRLIARGTSIRDIAGQLHTTKRTVSR